MEELIRIINKIRAAKKLELLDSLDETALLRDDLNLDSFDMAELTVHIEEEFGVDVFEDGIIKTVGEILAKIK